MANVVHIYINGIIAYEPSKEFAEYVGFTRLADVQAITSANPDADEFVLHINSPGGDVNEGFGIYDHLIGLGKKITTLIEARCYSIATVVALAGSTRKMQPNAEFMIHNPWSGAIGDADDLQKASDNVRAAEDRMANFYAEKTGADLEQIKSMMKEETFMTSAQALEMKFVTEIVEPVKAFALSLSKTNKNKKPESMSTEKKAGILAAIKAGFTAMKNAMGVFALDLTINGGDMDGKTLHIDTEGEPAAGQDATIDGNAASGTYMTTNPADGSQWEVVCAAGKVTTATKQDAQASGDAAEISALKAQIAQMEAQHEAELQEVQASVQALTAEVQDFKAKKAQRSNYQPPVQQQQRQQQNNASGEPDKAKIEERRKKYTGK